MCHRGKPVATKLPKGITEKTSSFKRFKENSVVLENGEDIPIDSVVYCTGYKFDFPFLPKGMIKLGKDNNICNIYQSILPVDYSTLLFMGLPRESPDFPTSEYQALFIRAVLDGTANLPSINERAEMVAKGISCIVDRYGWLDWIVELAEMANTNGPQFGKALKQIWDYHYNLWLTDWPNCWSLSYKINGPDSFVIM